MGIIYIKKPAFLTSTREPATMNEYFFIKKGGNATWGSTKLSVTDMDLVCISHQNDTHWIGNFAEGMGLVGVHFAKEDCRKATPEEVEKWCNSNWLERRKIQF